MPFFFDAYPYTNFHNVNLDWVLQAVKAWGKTVEKNDELYTELNAAFNDFKQFVQGYLAELDISEEINAKLDQMLEDGTLTPYFAPYIRDYTQQYVNQWLGSHVDPTAPALDDTLTLSNGAAQAAATGRRLGEAAYFAAWETPHDYTYIKLADVIPGYRLNSIAYDYNGHYYACGGSREKNGMGFIAVMSKPDFSDAVVTEIPGLGHANDITYDNGYLYVCTANDDGASEGGAPLNAIVKIKADDFNTRTVISNCPENTIGICYVRQGFWILAPNRIYRTTDFTSYTLVVSNIYSMMESYGLTSEGRSVQSLYRSPGNMPALVCAYVRDGSHYGAITLFDHDSGEAVGFKTFESYQGEVEGAVYGEGATWIVTDSSGGGATILRSDLLRQRYNLLATGDDLNDIVGDSISYCTGANVAAGVVHGPVSDTGYTVLTYRQGLYNTTQVASDNRGHYWHRYRTYTSGAWTEWIDEVSAIKGDLSAITTEDVMLSDVTDYTTNDGFVNYNGNITSVSSWRYFRINVTPLKTYKVQSYAGQSARLWVCLDADDNVIGYSQDNTAVALKIENVTIPDNGAYIVVNCQYSHLTDFRVAEMTLNLNVNNNKIIIDGQKIESLYVKKPVTLVKSDNVVQVQSEFNGMLCAIEGVIGGSNNGGFTFTQIYTADVERLGEHVIVTDNIYKGCGDDITPIHYNGSYRGANHGKSPVFKITKVNHGYTEANIGELWLSNYVIVKVDNANNFLVIGNTNGSKNDVIITTPQVSDATVSAGQLYPSLKHYTFQMRNDKGQILNSNGFLTGTKISFDESYELIDIIDMIEYLKANVGNNTNSTYYSDAIKSEMMINNTYMFEDKGVCIIAANAVPLKAGIWVEHYGGVQAGKMPDNVQVYAPFSNYDVLTIMGSASINLDKTVWKDSTFPPYKMYQFTDGQNRGFVTGYLIDYGQGLPNSRASTLNGNNGAGFWYTSKKMYPHFYDCNLADAPDLYGKSLSFYCYRAPCIIVDGVCATWLEVNNVHYCELEIFTAKTFDLILPDACKGRRIEIVKKTDSLNIPANIASADSLKVFASDKGSATLRFH